MGNQGAGDRSPRRRQFLKGAAASAVAVVPAVAAVRATAAPAPPRSAATAMPMTMKHAQHPGFPTGSVPVERAGIDPTAFLRDFDRGQVSTLPDGRTLREWQIIAQDTDIEIAPGIVFAAWTYNGRVPGPTLWAEEGDLLRVHFTNNSSHPHTMHFHGVHTAEMDGVPGVGAGNIDPGLSTTYEFEALPFGTHLYHCHTSPLAAHIAKGLYGAFLIEPKAGRAPADDEMVMVMNGYNTDGGNDNEFYSVNGLPFHFMDYPVQVKRNALVRVHLVNILEYDPINSFHLHANFFYYYPTGTMLTPSEYTDTISQAQGQRGMLEIRFPYVGLYMFHAHKTEFAELGWMGFFEVSE